MMIALNTWVIILGTGLITRGEWLALLQGEPPNQMQERFIDIA